MIRVQYFSLICFVLLFATVEAFSATYYVDDSGSNNNAGTKSAPFKTIQYGVNKLAKGDTLYIRAGNYHEKITVNASGTASEPITIVGYPGEKPVIDGQYTLPTGTRMCWTTINGIPVDPPICSDDTINGNKALGFVYASMVTVNGAHVKVGNINITGSRGAGIYFSPEAHHGEFADSMVFSNRHRSIRVDSDSSKVLRNVAYDNANFAPFSRDAKLLNWPTIVALKGDNIEFSANHIYNNWGEGISVQGNHNDVHHNLFHDNYALNIYSVGGQSYAIRNNVVYSKNPKYFRGGLPSQCIVLDNEANFCGETSKEQIIVNNLAYNCKRNLNVSQRTPLQNAVIANNTLINAQKIGLWISNVEPVNTHPNCGGETRPPHKNVVVANNLVVQTNGAVTHDVTGVSAIKMNGNVFTTDGTSYVNVSGIKDVKASEFALKKAVAGYSISQALSILPTAIKDKASTLLAKDFYDNARPSTPDVGAIEYGSTGDDGIPTPPPADDAGSTPPPVENMPGTSSAVVSVSASNLISNGDFGSGKTDWKFYSNKGGSFSVSGGVAKISLSSLSGTGNIQLYQPNVSGLVAGQCYRLSLRAKSDKLKKLEVAVHKHGSPYTNYGLSSNVTIGTGFSTITKEFTATKTADDARLRISFHKNTVSGASVTELDDISLSLCGGGEGSGDVGGSSDSDVTTMPSASNLVSNGDFGSGKTDWKFYSNKGGSFSVSGGVAKISLSSLSGTGNIQLYQPNVSGLVAGQCYRLSLRAKSDKLKKLELAVQKHGSPYTNYGLSSNVTIGTGFSTITKEFTATKTADDARLRISFHKNTITGASSTELDDVSLVPCQ